MHGQVRIRWLGAAAAALVVTGGLARADSLIVNGSFEQPNVGGSFVTYPSGSSQLTGWTISTGTVALGQDSIDHIGSYWQAAEGNQSIDLDGSPGDVDEAAAISQAFTTVVGQTYELTFALAGNPDLAGLKTVQVSAGSLAETFTFLNDTENHSNMGWQYFTRLFTATGASTVLTFDSSTIGWFGPALDDISVTAVPLPMAAWAGLGLIGVVGASRVRRARLST